MIKLKSGFEVDYNQDFDKFFIKILESIISESKSSVSDKIAKEDNELSKNDIFMKEIMDNSIYVTLQLFELAKENEELSKFIVSGFIFNSIIIYISQLGDKESSSEKNKKNIIH